MLSSLQEHLKIQNNSTRALFVGLSVGPNDNALFETLSNVDV